MKIKIYTGLSIGQDLVKEYLKGAICSPPIKRKDLQADINEGFHIVGIIDGEFLQNLAVAPNEIMDAIRCGVKIYGASSMGALRAAELKDYGMLGCGEVFKHICAQQYFNDDHLGQIFYSDSVHASLPFVDFLLAIRNLKNKIAPKDIKFLEISYQDLHFSERSLKSLSILCRESVRRNKLLNALSLIEKNIVQAKKQDGIELLKLIKTDIEFLNQRVKFH